MGIPSSIPNAAAEIAKELDRLRPADAPHTTEGGVVRSRDGAVCITAPSNKAFTRLLIDLRAVADGPIDLAELKRLVAANPGCEWISG